MPPVILQNSYYAHADYIGSNKFEGGELNYKYKVGDWVKFRIQLRTYKGRISYREPTKFGPSYNISRNKRTYRDIYEYRIVGKVES